MYNVIQHLNNNTVKKNISMMMTAKQAARELLISNSFTEIDTPILMPETGEGYNETFNIMLEETPAMLADSPQIYKMLLIHAGYEKYFQFAHCFRKITNENNIHTRLSEFTQLDLELRHTNLQALTQLAESLITKICESLNKTITITYMQGPDCLLQYGEEMKPDLRHNPDDVSVVFIQHMPLTTDGKIPCHHIFARPTAPDFGEDTDTLTKLTTESFDIIINGIEIGGGDMRIHTYDLQRKMMKLFNVDEKRYTNYLSILKNSNCHHNGGFAIGLERLIMALANSENIRQVTAFPDYYRRGGN